MIHFKPNSYPKLGLLFRIGLKSYICHPCQGRIQPVGPTVIQNLTALVTSVISRDLSQWFIIETMTNHIMYGDNVQKNQ